MIDIVPVDLRRYISERQHQEAESVRKQLMCCSGWSWRCRSHRPSSYACSTCIASSFSLEASPPCSSSKSLPITITLAVNREEILPPYRTIPYEYYYGTFPILCSWNYYQDSILPGRRGQALPVFSVFSSVRGTCKIIRRTTDTHKPGIDATCKILRRRNAYLTGRRCRPEASCSELLALKNQFSSGFSHRTSRDTI